MRISCLQYTAEPDLDLSESRLYPLLDEAVAARASVALLPECALFLSSDQATSRAHALAIDSPQVERLRSYASTHRITLIVGSLIMQIDDQILNRTLVIDAEGQIQTSYD